MILMISVLLLLSCSNDVFLSNPPLGAFLLRSLVDTGCFDSLAILQGTVVIAPYLSRLTEFACLPEFLEGFARLLRLGGHDDYVMLE